MVGILDGEVETLNVGQNEMRHRRPLDAFSATCAMAGPTRYVLRPSRGSGSNKDSLFRVGGDLYKYVAWQVFRPGPSRWADRLGNVVELARPPGYFDQSYIVLPLT
jgi:hypothetical protein